MNLEPLQRQAEHNKKSGWGWVFAHPDQVDDLIEGYRDAWRRLGAVHELAVQAQLALADHHLTEQTPNVRDLLQQIVTLAGIEEAEV